MEELSTYFLTERSLRPHKVFSSNKASNASFDGKLILPVDALNESCRKLSQQELQVANDLLSRYCSAREALLKSWHQNNAVTFNELKEISKELWCLMKELNKFRASAPSFL